MVSRREKQEYLRSLKKILDGCRQDFAELSEEEMTAGTEAFGQDFKDWPQDLKARIIKRDLKVKALEAAMSLFDETFKRDFSSIIT